MQQLDTEEQMQGQGLTASRTPRGPKLATLIDCRKEMGKVYREMRAGKVPCQDGTKLTYVLGAIAGLIESSDLATRVEALEQALRSKN